MIQKDGVEFATFSSAKGKRGPDATTSNKKIRKYRPNTVQADNVIKRNGVRINRKEYKNKFFPKQGHLTKEKTCRYPSLGLNLSMNVNKTAIYLVTQSL